MTAINVEGEGRNALLYGRSVRKPIRVGKLISYEFSNNDMTGDIAFKINIALRVDDEDDEKYIELAAYTGLITYPIQEYISTFRSPWSNYIAFVSPIRPDMANIFGPCFVNSLVEYRVLHKNDIIELEVYVKPELEFIDSLNRLKER